MFQSLQGTIPTQFANMITEFIKKVSIPSRYDPNPCRQKAPFHRGGCFNPFKVRSQLNFRRVYLPKIKVSIPSRYDPNETLTSSIRLSRSQFQSLQGTIPTTGDVSVIEDVFGFQSLQGTIPTHKNKPYSFLLHLSFNPFKVRSQLC